MFLIYQLLKVDQLNFILAIISNRLRLLYFDYSVNGGVDWTNIETFNGADTTLKLKEYSLSQKCLLTNIIFRFNIITDEIVHEEGAVIDDFIVEGTSLSFTNDFDQYVSIFPNPTEMSLPSTLQIVFKSIILVFLITEMASLRYKIYQKQYPCN